MRQTTTGLTPSPAATKDLLDIDALQEQAAYYERCADEIRLEQDGRTRFRRAALALRFTAQFILRHGETAIGDWTNRR